ncbi:MAG: hypothetical protein RI885_280 [Actinomycetota bacterium]
MKTARSLTLTLALAMAMGLGMVTPSHAGDRDDGYVSTVVVPASTSVAGGTVSSSLRLTFDQPKPKQEADAFASQLKQSMAESVQAAQQEASRAAAVRGLNCNSGFTVIDTNGTFAVQWACGSTNVPWGYRLSTAVQLIVVGTVAERRMDWAVNGVSRGRQAPHPAVPAGYQFHGTFSNVAAGRTVNWNDTISFRFNGGSGLVSIQGAFKLI